MKTEKQIIDDLKQVAKCLRGRLYFIETAINLLSFDDEGIKKSKVILSTTETPLHELPKGSRIISKIFCLECHKPFDLEKRNSKYCSKQCAKKVSNRTARIKEKAKKQDQPVAVDPPPPVDKHITDQHKADQDRKLA